MTFLLKFLNDNVLTEFSKYNVLSEVLNDTFQNFEISNDCSFELRWFIQSLRPSTFTLVFETLCFDLSFRISTFFHSVFDPKYVVLMRVCEKSTFSLVFDARCFDFSFRILTFIRDFWNAIFQLDFVSKDVIFTCFQNTWL
jgi:hypothetical protein